MYIAFMVALQIRDVPEDVRAALAERARERSQSLQAYLLSLVQTDARRSRNATVLGRLANRSDGTRSRPGETAAQMAAGRKERDAHLGPPG